MLLKLEANKRRIFLIAGDPPFRTSSHALRLEEKAGSSHTWQAVPKRVLVPAVPWYFLSRTLVSHIWTISVCSTAHKFRVVCKYILLWARIRTTEGLAFNQLTNTPSSFFDQAILWYNHLLCHVLDSSRGDIVTQWVSQWRFDFSVFRQRQIMTVRVSACQRQYSCDDLWFQAWLSCQNVTEVANDPRMCANQSFAKIRYIGFVVGFLRELLQCHCQWQYVVPYKVGY